MANKLRRRIVNNTFSSIDDVQGSQQKIASKITLVYFSKQRTIFETSDCEKTIRYMGHTVTCM